MSRYRDRDGPDCKVYVGDLGSSASKQDLEEAFRHYGPLKNVWVARHPPGFAFVEFEDVRDAEDAVRGLDGRSICGRRVRVEPSNAAGRRRNGGGGGGGGGGGRGPPNRRGRPYHPDDKCYQCGERGHYARDCNRYDRRGRSRRTRSSTRSRSRSRDRRSRSRGAGGGGGGGSAAGRGRGARSRSKSESRSRSQSRGKRSKTPERPRSASRERDSKSYSRSRSGSPERKAKSNGVAD